MLNIVYQTGIAHQSMLHQLYQSNPPYRSYQRSNKKIVYPIGDEKTDPHLKGFYVILKWKDKEVQYSNKRFDYLNTNFIGIETSYKKCEAFFFPNLDFINT